MVPTSDQNSQNIPDENQSYCPYPQKSSIIIYNMRTSDKTMLLGSNWNHQYSTISQWHPYSKRIVWLAAITIISSMFYIHQYNKEYSIIFTMTKDAYTENRTDFEVFNFHNLSDNITSKYLVFNSKCRIPNLDPFNDDVKPYIKTKAYTPCTKYDPLTYLVQSHNGSILHINSKMKKSYAPKGKLSCCYSIIRRELYKKKKNLDDSYTSSDCIKFTDKVNFNSTIEFIIVKCTEKRMRRTETVYSNAHSVVPYKKNIVERIEKFKANDTVRPISVIMIGIDSISRLNLFRSMPKTAKHLKANGWFELQGYNKMDDNTFPNLMAIFAGFNQKQAYSICDPKKYNKLNDCPLLLYTFRKLGYATAYAEDEATISTFNYIKKGFNATPTDHYLRPLVLASQNTLKIKTIDGLHYCLGSETSEELVLNYAEQFMDTYKNDPYFGFFWMNSFSHNGVNDPSMLDLKTKQWFEMIRKTGVYENSIIIFLSDHGMRFGKIRETNSGWLEERLPFIYFWLPDWFQGQFPKAVENLKINANRFTTPYDLHMTLQDILVKSNRLEHPVPSLACPKCQSLFEEMDINRSCEDANINMHWCTCYGFKTTTKSVDVKVAAEVFIQKIRHILASHDETQRLCKHPTLKRIIEARVSKQFSNNSTYYLLIIEASPAGEFEGTVVVTIDNNGEKKYEIVGEISRIDKYGSQSYCITDAYLKRFCYCIH